MGYETEEARALRQAAGGTYTAPAPRPVTADEKRRFDPATPIEEAPYIVFDTELTGLKPRKDSIVALGAVKMTGGQIFLGNFFSRVVSPRTELTGSSVVIHGITPSEASQCPGIEKLLPEFLRYCRGYILVGHVVSIDLRFLNREMQRLYGYYVTNPMVDTFSLYHYLRKKEEGECAFQEGLPAGGDLFTLARKFGIKVHTAHNALGDAYITAQIFQRFLPLLPRYGVRTVGDLLRAGKP